MIGSLFSSAGRIGRKHFWLVLAGACVVYLAAQILARRLGDSPLVIVFVPVGICLVVVNVNNTAKRLHDFGRSGWWQLAPLPVCVAVGLLVVAIQTTMPTLALVLIVLVNLALLAFWIAIGALRGDAQANRFGPPPTETRPTEVPA